MRLKTPILITGASGFVGANLLHRLIKESPPKKIHVLLRKSSNTWRINHLLKKVSVHVVDLQDQHRTDELLHKLKPKTIFHLATYGAYPDQLDEKEVVDTNIICTFNLLLACLRVGFNAFVNTGSSSEYGVNQELMREVERLTPITSYGVSKSWATLYCQYLNLTQQKPITTLRLFGVYGFYEAKGRLIPNVILSLLESKQPTLVAAHFARDFIFVDDVVDAFLCAATGNSREFIFNIGSAKQITLKEIYYLIRNIMKVDLDPILNDHADHLLDTNRRIADIKLAKKYLGWEPVTNLESGLQKTVEWFKQNRAFYQ